MKYNRYKVIYNDNDDGNIKIIVIYKKSLLQIISDKLLLSQYSKIKNIAQIVTIKYN